ncbi:MAG: hypothetical protein IPG93_10900 [Burkholderiales bacterium]|nr:hypothetical protein [Burkholderiales bacterium]
MDLPASVGITTKAGTVDDLQRHAAQEVESMRDRCGGTDGGSTVLHCLCLCALHGLPIPPWLRDEFVTRHHLVADAHVKSWDQAFGRPWPKRTRLATVRRHATLMRRVHDEVWKLAAQRPDLAIKRILFEEVGSIRGIDLGCAAVERLYYESLRAGFVNVAQWRRAMGMKTPAARASRMKVDDR